MARACLPAAPPNTSPSFLVHSSMLCCSKTPPFMPKQGPSDRYISDHQPVAPQVREGQSHICCSQRRSEHRQQRTYARPCAEAVPRNSSGPIPVEESRSLTLIETFRKTREGKLTRRPVSLLFFDMLTHDKRGLFYALGDENWKVL
jgi:hypothetical protein